MYYKYRLQKKQVSTDSGVTWIDVSPLETRKGSVVGTYNTYSECISGTPEPPTPSGDLSKPLTLEIVSAGTICFSWGEYSIDNGATWNSVYTAHEATLNLNVGDKVLLRGDRSQNPHMYRVITQNSTAYYKVYNNFNSMITPVGFENITTLQYGYSNAFSNTNVVDASGLLLPCTTLTVNQCYMDMFAGCSSLVTPPALPATTLSQDCYRGMFGSCTNLTSAPALPATTLADFCYTSMFYRCSSLTTAPELPATTLADFCYLQMFYGCTSLQTAQQILPATTLTDSCYNRMFYGCTRLATAPELPATTLTYSCYAFMFAGCTSLTTAPDLPAPTLAERCYYELFNGCTSLNYIKCLATDISANQCTWYFTSHVASSGTFVKAASMRSWQRNSDGIPTGWTVQNA